MPNKNANFYNIEKNFKYNTLISTFSEHITLSIDIWQLKCQQKYRIKTANFSSSSFWEKALWNRNLLLLTATARHSWYTPTFHQLFGTYFLNQNKNNVIETISCFVGLLSKKYCIYYVSEHLKYCSQINEYWLNRNACLNIVLDVAKQF